MFTTLDRVKQHLNIDLEYQDDDELLLAYIQASEEAVEKYINCKLSNLMTDEGYIPFTLQSAILLMVANLYNNREPVSIGGTPVKIPYTLEFLMQLNKLYK